MAVIENRALSHSALSSDKVGVLILAYQRSESLAQIMNICEKNGIKRIYVSLDVPKIRTFAAEDKTKHIKKLIEEFGKNFHGDIFVRTSGTNLGCGVAVLSGCDWIFRREEYAIILEDDCIPTDDFFTFAIENLPTLKFSQDIAAVCGSQFYPGNLEQNSVYEIKYPIFWGWATSQEKWSSISERLNLLLAGEKLDLSSLKLEESIYWQAGCRRVLDGFVDTWDTLISAIFLENGLKVISPSSLLVQNIGNDEVATHTSDGSDLHKIKVGRYFKDSNLSLNQIHEIDEWMRTKLYRISLRHLFTTRATWLLDLMYKHRRITKSLSERYSYEP
jgi:hypothetical protein